jgi:hypothetical protein
MAVVLAIVGLIWTEGFARLIRMAGRSRGRSEPPQR